MTMKHTAVRIFVSLLAIGVTSRSWGAESRSTDRLVGRELRGIALVVAASEAAGSNISSLDQCVWQFQTVCDEVESPSIEALHRVLHEKLLTGRYRRDLYDVVETLQQGDYNCLTAAILLQALCDQNHVSLRVVASPRHVTCRRLDDTIVEPTCPNWFQDPRHAVRACDAFPDEIPLQPLDSSALIARIHYNRGLERLSQGEFELAVDQFRIAQTLDATYEEARANELAALNNWSLRLCQAGEFAQAADRLELARTIDPTYPPLAANDLHIHHRWTTELCREGRYREALGILAAGRQRQPAAPVFAQGPAAVTQAWVTALLRDGDSVTARRVFDEVVATFPDIVSLRAAIRWDECANLPGE